MPTSWENVKMLSSGALAASGALLLAMMLTVWAGAQQGGTNPAAHRTHLILKDGSYQIVMSYRVKGDRVLFISAERGGTEEEIPVALVDFEATHRWERRHAAAADTSSGDIPSGETSSGDRTGAAQGPAIDPELRKEEEERRSLTPEVAPDLRLPEQDGVLALDTFRGTPELVPLVQSAGDLNQTTSHNVLRSMVNPLASSHQIVQLRGERAAVQLHINQPVLYVRLGDESGIRTGGTPLTVDTHGAAGPQGAKPGAPGGSAESQYVVIRVDVRQDARVVASFNINQMGQVKQQEDVVETTTEVLPGGHWMRVTPRAQLSFGEYALMEVISPKEINLGVWDFGVHPMAAENRDVLKPEARRPVSLERRGPD